MSVYIIAEAGVNHNGSIERAYEMVDAAKSAGADCIKFQTFITEELVTIEAEKAEYQKLQTGAQESQYQMLKKLELSFQDFKEIKAYCDKIEIDFASTAFDLKSIAFLNTLKMKFWKVPSGEITNFPYLRAIGLLGEPVILSTGMSTLEEIEAAYRVLTAYGSGPITILHCTTQYPAPFESVNLKAMLTIEKEFKTAVGYSDHTKGTEVAIAAVALGAKVIEKHFTLDKSLPGPDHKASLEPDELKKMIEGIRHIEKALGSSEKKVMTCEATNKIVARKCLVAKSKINKGEKFTEDNLAVKRAGEGINPMRWMDVLGEISPTDFEENEMIHL